MKKGGLRTGFIFLLVAFLVAFAAASFVLQMKSEDKLSGNIVKINSNNAIQVPDSHQPVPNVDEGTIVLWTKPPVEIFDQFSDARDYIIFYSSTNMPGMRVVYNLDEKRFEAGTPLMTTPEIDIFDGQNHQLAYTFKKGFKQALFLDGNMVNSSEFTPIDSAKITAFAVALHSIDEADIKGIEVAVYDRQLGGNSLKEI